MPIEIRELSIKTQIVSAPAAQGHTLSTKELQQLKNQLLQECKMMLKAQVNKNSFDR